MKQCKICKETKPLDDFHLCKAPHRASYCKPCQAKFIRQWRLENLDELKAKKRAYYALHADPHKRWATHMYSRYGITEEDYQIMWANQQGKCAICGRKETQNARQKRLGIDHCHSTGLVRGLLCDKCNNLLSRADDNIDVLQKAIQYLRASQKVKGAAK